MGAEAGHRQGTGQQTQQVSRVTNCSALVSVNNTTNILYKGDLNIHRNSYKMRQKVSRLIIRTDMKSSRSVGRLAPTSASRNVFISVFAEIKIVPGIVSDT